MEDDESVMHDDGCSREQSVAFALESYLKTLVQNASATSAVSCSVNQSAAGAPCEVICCIQVSDDDLSEAATLLCSELSVRNRVDDAVAGVVNIEAVVPQISVDADAVPTQIFRLELMGGYVQPADSEVASSTTPLTGDPNYGLASDDYEHVIVLVHGIRDIGAWQDKVSSQLTRRGTIVKQIRYGLYPAIRFLSPINLSSGAVARVVSGLSDIRNEYRNARISVIAHSFGTYVLLKALDRDPNLELWKIIFCGSVADDRLRWANFKHRIGDQDRPTSDFVLNDCGTGDIWPLMGASFGWYYGMAGVTGFSEELVRNRFHRATGGTKGGHGLYFDTEFVKEKWRPFLIEDAAPARGDGRQGEHLPWLAKVLYHGWIRVICRCAALLLWCVAILVANTALYHAAFALIGVAKHLGIAPQ